MTRHRLRPAARALILDESSNVLLVHFDWPGLEIEGGFWACPGGEIEAHETAEQALARELEEELGLVDAVIEGGLWSLSRLFPMAQWDGQEETWYLVRIRHFTPQARVDLAAENVHAVRWFTREEITRHEVTFSPRDLDVQLDRVLREGIPSVPHTIPAL